MLHHSSPQNFLKIPSEFTDTDTSKYFSNISYHHWNNCVSIQLTKKLQKSRKIPISHFFRYFFPRKIYKSERTDGFGCNQPSKHSVSTICKLAQVEIFPFLFRHSCLLIHNFFHLEKEDEKLPKILRQQYNRQYASGKEPKTRSKGGKNVKNIL